MKLGSKFWHIFWVSAAAIAMVGMFMVGYHSPIKTNEKSQTEVLEILKQNPEYDSVLKSTIKINPYIGSLEIGGKNEEIQDFSFITVKDSITTQYNGWLLIDKKFMGYDIDTVIVNK